MSPRQLSNWVHLNLNNMNIIFVMEEEDKEKKLLLGKFLKVSPISRTQKLHTFLTVRNGVLLAKKYPASLQSNE
jgi:hypothetical protein